VVSGPLNAAADANRTVVQSSVGKSAVTQRTVQSARGGDPAGRTYYTVIVGTGETITDLTSDCLSFDATEFCTSDGTCGSWSVTSAENKMTGFDFSIVLLDEDGVAVDVEGRGRVDFKGPRSSVGAAARASAQGAQINFSLAGRSLGKAQCLNLLESDGI